MISRIHDIGRTECFGKLKLRRVCVDRNDATGTSKLRAVNHRQADATQPKHDNTVAGLHLGGVLDGTEPGGDPAAEQTHLLGVGAGVDFCK